MLGAVNNFPCNWNWVSFWPFPLKVASAKELLGPMSMYFFWVASPLLTASSDINVEKKKKNLQNSENFVQVTI